MIAVKLTEDQALKDAIFPIEAKVYLNGSQVKPSAATITVKDEDGTALVSAATMTIDAGTGTLTYSLAATHTADLAEDCSIEIDYTVDGTAGQAMFFFDVVLQKLTANVVDADLRAYFPQLGDELWAGEVSYAGQIEEAFLIVKRSIRDKGKRPAMLLDGAQVRELVIIQAFKLIFFNFSKASDDIWWSRYLKYEGLFTERFAGLRIKYDEDESGTIDSDETAQLGQVSFRR